MIHQIRIYDEELYQALTSLGVLNGRNTNAEINYALMLYVQSQPKKLSTIREDRLEAFKKATEGL